MVFSDTMSEQQASKNYYVLTLGKKCGIYTDWAQCQKQVKNVPSASIEGFDDIDVAVKFILENTELVRSELNVFDHKGKAMLLSQHCTLNGGNETMPKTLDEPGIIIDPVLTYVTYALDISPADLVSNCCVQFYDVAELKHAKDILWRNAHTDTIGSYIRRRDGATRSESEALVLDIIGAIQKLDQNDKLPRMAVDPTGLHRIPKASPSETNSLSMCERLNKMDQRMKSIEESLSDNVCRTIGIEEKVSSFTSYSNVVVRGTTPSAPPLSPEQCMPPPAVVPPLNRVTTSTAQHHALSVKPADVRPRGIRPNTQRDGSNRISQSHLRRSASQLSMVSNTSQQSAPYEFQPTERRRLRRRVAPIVGTGHSDRIRGAPEPSRDLFVYRVGLGVNASDIKHYICDKNVDVRDIEQTSKEGSMFMSFKVTVKASDMDNMLHSEFWPTGICVRRFRKPRPYYENS